MKLTARMMLYILGVVMVGMIASSVFIYMKAENMFTQSTEDTQISLAQGTAAKLDTLVTALQTYVHLQSEGARILNTLLLKPYDSVEKREKIINLGLQQIAALKSRSGRSFEAVAILNREGAVVTATNPAAIGTSYADQPCFREALAKDSMVISRPLMSRVTGKPVFYVLDPIVDKTTNKTVGILLASANIAAISAESVDAIKVGERGYAFAIDAGGMAIMHPDKGKILHEDVSDRPWGQDMLRRKNGVITYTWDGEARTAAFATVPNTGWAVVVTAERSDLLTPVMTIRNISMVTTIVTLLVIAVVIFVIVHGIVASLRRGVEFAQAVASGDLSREWRLRRTDEIGILGRALQIMVNNLKETLATAERKTVEAEAATDRAEQAVQEAEEARVRAERARSDGMLAAAGHIEGVVQVISEASGRLNTQIEHSDACAGESARRLAATNTSMDEMNNTVLQVSRNASAASLASDRARRRAEEGADIVNKVVSDIAEMQSQSLEMKADMEMLGTQAEAINHVMGVISDIADQTNLLALNAAIEAARAGEAGRGFAVVADEVRKLAEKTMGSTTEVGNAIREIQQSARKNMGNVDRTTQMIESTTELARQSGDTLRDIVKLVDETSDQVRSIAAASEEQSASSESITRSVNEVNKIATDTAQAMAEARQAVAALVEQSLVLKNLVDDMKKG